MELLIKILGAVETCALVFGLLYATRAIKAKGNDAERKPNYRRAGIYIGIFLVLTLLRHLVF